MLIYEQIYRVDRVTFHYAGKLMPLHGPAMIAMLVIFLVLRRVGRISSSHPPEGEHDAPRQYTRHASGVTYE
jgi:hypothetical protein